MLKALSFIFCLLLPTFACAALTVHMQAVTPAHHGETRGTIQVEQTPYGLLFTPQLQGLTPGIHGFHIHEHPSCDQNGMAAGGHFDPKKTHQHLGPYNNNGHLGDLPALSVTADGQATLPVLAPRLTHLQQIKNHALIIHEGGDNYADEPAKLGGGGTKMVCGVIR